jgi:hypothetical protein
MTPSNLSGVTAGMAYEIPSIAVVSAALASHPKAKIALNRIALRRAIRAKAQSPNADNPAAARARAFLFMGRLLACPATLTDSNRVRRIAITRRIRRRFDVIAGAVSSLNYAAKVFLRIRSKLTSRSDTWWRSTQGPPPWLSIILEASRVNRRMLLRSLALGEIHRNVGILEKLTRFNPVIGKAADADAASDSELTACDRHRFCNSLLNSIDDRGDRIIAKSGRVSAITNSSPPNRAIVSSSRRHDCSRAATLRNSSSPAVWPRLSLINFS